MKEYILKDILLERKEYSEKGKEYTHVTLSKEGIKNKTERYNRDFLVKDKNKKYKITHLKDICYNPANLKFGVICLNNYGDAIFSPIYVTFELKKEYTDIIDMAYLSYILTSDEFIQKARKYEQGTVYERMAVNSEDFLSMKVKIPSKQEQEKIVQILDNCNETISKYEQLIKEKDLFIKSQFVKVSNCLARKKIGDICSIKARIGWQGLTKKEYLAEGEYHLVTGTDFQNHKINFDTCHFISRDRYEQDTNIQLKKGDVLVTKDGTIGKVAIVDDLDMPATLNSGIFVLRDITGQLNNIYLGYSLLSFEFQNFIENLKTGSTIAHLNQGAFMKFKIPVPTLEEQNRFAKIVQQIDKQKNLLEKQIENYKRLKKALMQQLLTGKIKVKK